MTPAIYLEMGIIVITLVLCTHIKIPDSSTMSIGLMYGGGETARQMYEELLERRAALSKEATLGDLEALEKLAKAQMEIGNRKQEL